MDKYNITIGADPEFFVKEKNKPEIIPACRLFGGEKGSPMFLSPDGGYLEDGTTVEFNVTPCKTIKDVRKKLHNLILVFLNKHDKYILSEASSAQFSPDILEKFAEARTIGCAPDLFAYGLRSTPSIAKFKDRRFAGGHIHVGIDPWPEGLEKEVFIKALDFLVLGPSAHKWSDTYRWPFYGHPGLYRTTDYGVEYRSPDNFWCNPAWYTSKDSKSRAQLDMYLIQFDEFFQNIRNILNFDEHGARLNSQLKNFIKMAEMDETMNKAESLASPSSLSHLRHYFPEITHSAGKWANERSKYSTNRAAMLGKVG